MCFVECSLGLISPRSILTVALASWNNGQQKTRHVFCFVSTCSPVEVRACACTVAAHKMRSRKRDIKNGLSRFSLGGGGQRGSTNRIKDTKID